MGTRPDTDASQFQDFNLIAVKDFLVSGPNVLAIHGLNASPTDPDFLIVAELVASRASIDTAGKRYFASPTPGSLNGIGTTTLGALITDVQHLPAEPSDTEDLLVSAIVSPTFNAVTNVSLYYRVMFGAETSVPMFDDGQHGDGQAGDHIFGASIPNTAYTSGQLVRYYIVSKDSANNQSRQPPIGDTNNSSLYFGTVVKDPSLTNGLPVLHWFTQNTINTTTFARAEQPLAQVRDQLLHSITIDLVRRVGWIDVRFEGLHQSVTSSCRPATLLPATAIRFETTCGAAPDRVHAIHLRPAALA